jgi:hypothetical protein
MPPQVSQQLEQAQGSQQKLKFDGENPGEGFSVDIGAMTQTDSKGVTMRVGRDPKGDKVIYQLTATNVNLKWEGSVPQATRFVLSMVDDNRNEYGKAESPMPVTKPVTLDMAPGVWALASIKLEAFAGNERIAAAKCKYQVPFLDEDQSLPVSTLSGVKGTIQAHLQLMLREK